MVCLWCISSIELDPREGSPSEVIGGITSWITGALSGRYSLIGSALAVYADSGLEAPDEPGSVEGGREGTVGAEPGGRGNGRIRDAIRMYRS